MLASADLDLAAKAVYDSRVINTGQVCNCAERVYVERSVHDALIDELKGQYTIAIVTHNMQQAARCSDYTAFMYLGELIEFGDTHHIFTSPTQKQTQQYITGRFG